MILEVCAFNIQSCFVAEKARASRIELCADPLQGGTTPSHGTVQFALERISIPVFPMVRPRGGNFTYDADELAIMKKDILVFRELGCPAIVCGVLRVDNSVDTDLLKRIVEWADPMKVTFHKAFDCTPDALQALEDIINAGCARVLTSGLSKTAIEGADLLSKLIAGAAGRIIIMPGGGVRSSNIGELIKKTGATEYHSSGLISKDNNQIADENEIRLLVEQLKS